MSAWNIWVACDNILVIWLFIHSPWVKVVLIFVLRRKPGRLLWADLFKENLDPSHARVFHGKMSTYGACVHIKSTSLCLLMFVHLHAQDAHVVVACACMQVYECMWVGAMFVCLCVHIWIRRCVHVYVLCVYVLCCDGVHVCVCSHVSMCACVACVSALHVWTNLYMWWWMHV